MHSKLLHDTNVKIFWPGKGKWKQLILFICTSEIKFKKKLANYY